jgi:hypothetical protein
MKKGLPKFVLLNDPYESLEGRILIFKTQYPRYIYELNRDDDEASKRIIILGEEYTIVVRKYIDNQSETELSDLKEAVRWYHFSKGASKSSEEKI